MPFADPLAPEGTLHVRLRDVVCELVKYGISLKDASGEVEKLYIQLTMASCNNNRTKAAKRLGIHRNTLNAKIEQHKLDT